MSTFWLDGVYVYFKAGSRHFRVAARARMAGTAALLDILVKWAPLLYSDALTLSVRLASLPLRTKCLNCLKVEFLASAELRF